jgi:hypothetical protein
MTPGRKPWSFRVMSSGGRGSNHSEIVGLALRQIRIAEHKLPKQRVAGSSPVSRSNPTNQW